MAWTLYSIKEWFPMCARTDFAEKKPEMYKLLLEEHTVPPRRTLVNLADGKIEIFVQPTDVSRNTVLKEYPFDTEGVNKALGFLRERRMQAGMQFDTPAYEELPASQRSA